MLLLKKLILLVLAIFLAALMAKYREKLVRTFGKNYYAEKYLGAGGSYTFWPLFGVIIVVIALIYMAS